VQATSLQQIAVFKEAAETADFEQIVSSRLKQHPRTPYRGANIRSQRKSGSDTIASALCPDDHQALTT
jgi:hypothetical protein